MRRSMSRLLVLGASIALAGCSSSMVPDPFLSTSSVSPQAESLATEVAPEFAAAFLPTLAGSVQSVRQTVRNHYLHQEIVYSNQTFGNGENVLTVTIGSAGEDGNLRPPTEAQVQREMRQALAGMNATMSPLIRDNVNGAYGYATASYGQGGSCIFAWQHIKSVSPDDVEGYVQFTRTRLSAQVRLRYCHPSIPADRIAVMMDGLRVKNMNADTISMLRFAAGSAHVAEPPVVIAPEPVKKVAIVRPKVVKQVVVEDDWRKSADTAKVDDEDNAVRIANAAAIPLPGISKDKMPGRQTEAVVNARNDQSARLAKPAFMDDETADASPAVDDGETVLKRKAAAIPVPQ